MSFNHRGQKKNTEGGTVVGVGVPSWLDLAQYEAGDMLGMPRSESFRTLVLDHLPHPVLALAHCGGVAQPIRRYSGETICIEN